MKRSNRIHPLLAIIFVLVLVVPGLLVGCQITAEPVGPEPVVFKVAAQPLVNIDPLLISSDSEVFVANNVYDYLVDLDPQSNIIPRLAASWQASQDGKTYTFELAPDVTWHDGTPFTSADVVWTFDRLRQAEGAPTVSLFANIDSILAFNENRVIFTLKEPNPFFLYDLSDNHALVMKKDTTDADTTFNGTGPFKVVNYLPEDRITLEKNTAYFIPGQPGVDQLEIIFFNDDLAAVEALRGGQVDLVMRMSTSLFESLKDVDGITTVDIPTNGFDLVRLRSDQAPGNDPRVVEALKLATDRTAIWQVVQQGYGAVGNDSPIGPLYSQYHAQDLQPPTRDVEAARALLEAAGYADGLNLTLYTPDTGSRPDLAAVLREQWAEAGINLELIVEPESVYYGENHWLDVTLGITGWGSRPYPQFYLDVMLVTGAEWNESKFSDPEFDALAHTAGTTLDENERVAAYRSIQQILIERGPVIIPYYFAQFAAYDSQFSGFALKAFAGRTDLRTVSLAGAGQE